MIGGLLCLIASRPNIMNAICLVGIYQANPKKYHDMVVKIKFRYLKGTMNYGLWYKKDRNFSLKVYIDANWASCVNDKISSSGGAFFLGRKLVY